jgi:hypothetical protein
MMPLTGSPFTSSASGTSLTLGRVSSALEARCLAEQSSGFYITVDTEQDLVAALEKTLDCPMISQAALR